MCNNDVANMHPLNRADQAERHYKRLLKRNNMERSWVNQMMRGIHHFHDMRFTKREHMHIGAYAMSWVLENGEPMVKALFEMGTVSISAERGLAYAIRVVSLNSSAPRTVIVDHQPRYLEEFEAYLWIPAHAEVLFKPPGEGPLVLPLAARVNHHIDSAPVDGGRFFGVQKDFAERWPSYQF